jgi:hypothetical protein
MNTATDSLETNSPKSGGGITIGQSSSDLVAFHGATPCDQGAALTAALTTITPADAEGTPDYAIAAVTNTSPYGLASAQEFITLLHVVKNLQVRLAEVEARLEEKGLVAAN